MPVFDATVIQKLKAAGGVIVAKTSMDELGMGGSNLTRYPDICNAILSSGCKVLVITQNLASPYLNTADFILQCGTTNRNDVGKYAALMANDLIVMGYMRAYDTAFQ